MTGHAALHQQRVIWLVLKNTMVRVGGRTFVSIAKFVGYILIVRFYGPDWFGQFSVIIALLSFSEILLDFGYNDIVVREVCQQPEKRHRFLSALACSKLLQIVAAYALLAILLLALRYPREIMVAGLIAGLELIFLGGVMVYRVVFQADMQMENDALGEVVCSSIFLCSLVWICTRGLGLPAMFVAYVLSRAVYALMAYGLGRRAFDLRSSRWEPKEMGTKFMTALPFGLSAFMAIIFNNQDIVMLSKMDTLHSVGLYSVAYRFVHPLVIIATALMAGLFPILSSYWGCRMDELRRLYQMGIDVSAVMAGMAFCFLQASSGFLIGLWGDAVMEATLALRVLAWAVAAFFISSMVAPMYIVVGKRWMALFFCCIGVIGNFLLNWILIPRYSYVGAAIATIATEAGLLIPTVWVLQRAIGFRIRWWVLLKAAAAAGVSLFVVKGLGLWDGLAGGVAAVVFYGVTVLITRAVSPEQLRTLVQSIKDRKSER